MLSSHPYSFSPPPYFQILLHSVHLQLSSPPFSLPPKVWLDCCRGISIIRGTFPPEKIKWSFGHMKWNFRTPRISDSSKGFTGSVGMQHPGCPEKRVLLITQWSWPLWRPQGLPCSLWQSLSGITGLPFCSFSQRGNHEHNKIKWDYQLILHYLATKEMSFSLISVFQKDPISKIFKPRRFSQGLPSVTLSTGKKEHRT